MIRLKTSEAKTLRFALDIEGSKSEPIVKYVIESTPFQYVFPGVIKNGSAEISIPVLNDFIGAGQYDSKIEVILEDNYYEPWKGSIIVEKPIEVKITEAEVVEDEKVTEKIKVKLVEDVDVKDKKKPVKKKYEKKDIGSLMEDLVNE